MRARTLLLLAGLLASACAVPGPGTPGSRSQVADDDGDTDLVGRAGYVQWVRARHEDTLTDIAREHDLGFLEIVSANPDVDPWLPGAGTRVVIPSVHVIPEGPREGVVINLAEQRLYLFSSDGRVEATHPIGVGRDGYETPLGQTTVVRKRERPTWYPPRSARDEDPSLGSSVPPGPENPLGDYALYLGWPSYLVHGTNEPDGVGRRVSRGCIRMFPEDIAALFERIEPGTPVRVIDQPVKLGWLGDTLYLEAHPSMRQSLLLDQGLPVPPEEVDGLEGRVRAMAGAREATIDWRLIEQALAKRSGVPVAVTPETTGAPSWWQGLLSRLGPG